MSRMLIVLALTLPACLGVRHVGSGSAATEERDVESFDAVHNATVVDVTLLPGAEPGVSLSCDDNLLDEIVTVVIDGELVIRTPPGVNIVPLADCTAEVGVEGLTAASLSGTGHVLVDGDADSLAVLRSSGTGRLAVEGRAGTLTSVDLSGTGAIEVAEAEADGCSLEILNSGTGAASIDSLTACALVIDNSGTGRTQVAGQVDSLNLKVSGTGGMHTPELVAREATIRLSGTGGVELTVLESLVAELSGTGGAVIHGDPAEREVSQSGTGRVRFE